MTSRQLLHSRSPPPLAYLPTRASIKGSRVSSVRGVLSGGAFHRRRTHKPLHHTQNAILRPAASVEPAMEAGHSRYESMVIVNPRLSDDERDTELAKFEAFLKKEMAYNIKVSVRGRHRLAYPIQGFMDGVYVMYCYTAPRSLAQKVQIYLSKPEVGAEGHILRHMTLNVSK